MMLLQLMLGTQKLLKTPLRYQLKNRPSGKKCGTLEVGLRKRRLWKSHHLILKNTLNTQENMQEILSKTLDTWVAMVVLLQELFQ